MRSVTSTISQSRPTSRRGRTAVALRPSGWVDPGPVGFVDLFVDVLTFAASLRLLDLCKSPQRPPDGTDVVD